MPTVANELARSYDGLPRARDLYLRALELDPYFAPAWAHLGRCHRVIGKYVEAATDSELRAQEALSRALDLNPRLSVAHKFYANPEADIGEAQRAVVRLLGEANRHGNDPELFAGLVHACRYCGLLSHGHRPQIRGLKELNGVTLIALTGYAQESDRKKTRDAGFQHHFVKPVDLETLEAVLADL